ncbi:hypothetical protein HYV50_02170 [Candidatus Pacearchaeota archaeon]|nr:hypothetical protein [Candidatus Pacearchaeota archaeon]
MTKEIAVRGYDQSRGCIRLDAIAGRRLDYHGTDFEDGKHYAVESRAATPYTEFNVKSNDVYTFLRREEKSDTCFFGQVIDEGLKKKVIEEVKNRFIRGDVYCGDTVTGLEFLSDDKE